MPWHLESEHPSCPASRPWAVVKDSDGEVAGCHASKDDAQAQMGALYAKEPQMSNENMEKRLLEVGEWEIRHTGRSTEGFTIRGYPVVYGQTSHDLGGFKEQIAPGALDEVLASNPDVHFVWDHDTRYVGARTTNNTLKLESDSLGLHITAEVGNYSWAKDLRVALERGDISQGSFAFTVPDGGDEWKVDDDENVMRTINRVDGLYDVTVTAQGAYPQTSLAAVRSLAVARGRPADTDDEAAPVAPDEGGEEQVPEEDSEEVRALKAEAELRRQELSKLKERIDRL